MFANPLLNYRVTGLCSTSQKISESPANKVMLAFVLFSLLFRDALVDALMV